VSRSEVALYCNKCMQISYRDFHPRFCLEKINLDGKLGGFHMQYSATSTRYQGNNATECLSFAYFIVSMWGGEPGRFKQDTQGYQYSQWHHSGTVPCKVAPYHMWNLPRLVFKAVRQDLEWEVQVRGKVWNTYPECCQMSSSVIISGGNNLVMVSG